MGRRKDLNLDPEKIIAIYVSPGRLKRVAWAFGVTESCVSYIRNGKLHADITKNYRDTLELNATLISTAFGVTQ